MTDGSVSVLSINFINGETSTALVTCNSDGKLTHAVS